MYAYYCCTHGKPHQVTPLFGVSGAVFDDKLLGIGVEEMFFIYMQAENCTYAHVFFGWAVLGCDKLLGISVGWDVLCRNCTSTFVFGTVFFRDNKLLVGVV